MPGLQCSLDSDDDLLPSGREQAFQVVSGSVQGAKTPPQARLRTSPQNLLAGPYSSTVRSRGLGPAGPSGARQPECWTRVSVQPVVPRSPHMATGGQHETRGWGPGPGRQVWVSAACFSCS